MKINKVKTNKLNNSKLDNDIRLRQDRISQGKSCRVCNFRLRKYNHNNLIFELNSLNIHNDLSLKEMCGLLDKSDARYPVSYCIKYS